MPGKGNSKNLNMMSKIATDLVVNKAMKDKMQIEQNKAKMGAQGRRKQNFRQENFSDDCLLYTSPSPRDQRGSRMPSSA